MALVHELFDTPSYIPDWHSRLENSTRARFYINIAQFKYQKYLDVLKVEKYRNSLCKLRVSAHRLEIETGRWTKPNRTPLDDRICLICGVLEDEFHFMLECSIYKDLRKITLNVTTGKDRICPSLYNFCLPKMPVC